MELGQGWSRTWTFFQEKWHEGNIPIMGPRTHAAWLCSVVFDGARAFEGVFPDLELHCARANNSAKKLFLNPVVSVETWVRLAREGIAKFEKAQANNGFLDHVVSLPTADAGEYAGRCEGGVFVSQQRSKPIRGARTRFRQCSRMRHAGKC